MWKMFWKIKLYNWFAVRRSTSKKRSKQVKNSTFCRFMDFFVVFFSFQNGLNFCFFFPLKKFAHHSLTRFQEAEKKKQPRKKKTQISLTHPIFHKKVQKLNYSGGKKKYDTFAKSKAFLKSY